MIQRNKGEKLMSGFEDFAFKYIRFILISTIVMLLIVSGEKIGLVIDKNKALKLKHMQLLKINIQIHIWLEAYW